MLQRLSKRALAKPNETATQRKKRLAKGHAERQELRQRLSEDDDAILSVKEWCSLCGFSARSARELLGSDDGPVVTQLSARRLGISRRHHREWMEKRSR